MKKLIYFVIAFSVMISSALATDITPRCIMNKENQLSSGETLYEVKLVWTSDGTDQSEFSLSDHCDNRDVMEKIEGGFFWEAETDQGATAPGTYTVEFDNEKGADLLSVTTTSTTKAEVWGSTDLGYTSPVWDMQIDYGDPGDSGDIIILYIKIIN